ncbi:G-protein coupled receptor Mth2-like isoform X2 [Onthophagus taurus]|uniref:G-protein coupled receptor Mth2-like isoform X2 n=1 Tax=Onthophagus taurus TaxID=166361 RepID=UPI0039BE96FB
MVVFVILYCVILCVKTVFSIQLPCPIEETVIIKLDNDYDDIMSTNLTNISYQGFTYSEDKYFQLDDDNTTIYGCVCLVKTCVKKCCPEGEMFINDSCGLSDDLVKSLDPEIYGGTEVINVTDTSKHIITVNFSCENRYRYMLDPITYPEYDSFYLQVDGSLYLPGIQENVTADFCFEFINGSDDIWVIRCGYADEEYQSFNETIIGMIISMPFLIATFLVYALLPDKNLPAKSLMCYVLSLLFAYIMLVTIQLNSNLEHGACVTIAYLCYFFFMVSFFWMNSSCIDIWLTFSGIKGITGQRTQERKRFIYYCLYSWGLPLIMTSIVVVMTMEHLKDSIFFTAIGDGQCWFKNGLSTGIYFYFPIAILLITNIVLFAITALKIRNVQRDTKVLNAKDSSKHEKDKQRIDEYNSEPCYLIEPVKNRGMQVYDFLDVDNSCLGFNLYIKLLFAMGVNWSMEVISWLVQWQSNNVPTYIWYITDFCNAMYGVLIFFIFVFKKNIWIMLKKRYLQIMGRSTRAHSMGTSTHRTTLFTAISLQSIPGAGLLTKMHSTPNDNRNELRPPKIH